MLQKGIDLRKKISYRFTIYSCIFVLIAVMLIVFVGYTYNDYRKECRETAGREVRTKVERIVSTVDNHLDSVMQYYLSTMSYDEITWLLENDFKYSDYSRYSTAQEMMQSKKIFTDYIRGFTFVNFNTDWVLTNKSMFKLEEACNAEILYELYDRQLTLYPLAACSWAYDSAVDFETKIDRKYLGTVETGGLSLIMKLPLGNLNNHGMLVVNINMDAWKNWIDQWLGEAQYAVILDQEGNIIYSTAHDLDAVSLKLQENRGEKVLYGYLPVEAGNAEYMVAGDVSDVLGWQYYVFYNMNEGTPIGMRLPWINIIMILLLVIGCSFGVSYMLYRPLGKLMANVTENPQRVVGNELSFLADRLADLKNDRKALETVITGQQGKLQELFELRLIRGEVRSDEEMEEYFKGLQLPPKKYYVTAVMVLDLHDGEDAQSGFGEDAICLKIVEELPQSIRDLCWMPPVYNACTIFCIFGENDETALLNTVVRFHKEILSFVEKACGFRILMGVSANHSNYRHFNAAYRESINALTMQSTTQLGAENGSSMGKEEEGCQFYLANSSGRSNVSYNTSFEKDIEVAIKSVDKDQCYNVTNDFFLFIKDLSSVDELMIYTLRFVNSILITAMEVQVNLEDVYPDGLKKMYRELFEALEPSRVRRYIKANVLDPILKARAELLEGTSYSMMEEIQKKLEESKGNITLTECAEALGVHPTYIWKVLKMEKGKSFMDYQEEYKINEAKRLLLQTDKTVAEIAQELNYTNAQNFIRFFSKSTGVTPGKFRKLY